MSSLLNPGGNTEKQTDIPANPFKHFIRWASTAGKWVVKTGGQTKELNKPLEVIVLDYLNTVGGGKIGVFDVWSKPYYRYTSQQITVWCKQVSSGKIDKVAEGKVEDVYQKLRGDYDASKSVKCYVFIPQTGQIALLDLSGYAISPFYDANTTDTEPGLILNLDPVEVTPKPIYGTRYKPTFSGLEVTDEAKQAAIKAFIEAGAIEYLNYVQGIENTPPDDTTQAEKNPPAEEKSEKTADPF